MNKEPDGLVAVCECGGTTFEEKKVGDNGLGQDFIRYKCLACSDWTIKLSQPVPGFGVQRFSADAVYQPPAQGGWIKDCMGYGAGGGGELSTKQTNPSQVEGYYLPKGHPDHPFTGQPVDWLDKSAAMADAQKVCDLTEEVEALRKFKAYVHKRLDDAGIPTHPEGEHSAHGCRIGDRLDITLKRESRCAFNIGDDVEVVKYHEWKGIKTVICQINQRVSDGNLTDEITYSTWSPGEGATTNWAAEDLRKITRIEDGMADVK